MSLARQPQCRHLGSPLPMQTDQSQRHVSCSTLVAFCAQSEPSRLRLVVETSLTKLPAQRRRSTRDADVASTGAAMGAGGRLFVCKTCHPLGFSAKLGPCGTVMCKRRQLGLAAPRAVVVRVLKNLGNTACAEPPQNRVDAGTGDLPRPRGNHRSVDGKLAPVDRSDH